MSGLTSAAINEIPFQVDYYANQSFMLDETPIGDYR